MPEADVKKSEGLTSFSLKIIAVSAMLSDHLSYVFFGPAMTPLRYFGRLGFPIFSFMIAEGISRTRDAGKYAKRLFIFGLVSEIPFAAIVYTGLDYVDGVNVYFTLLASLSVCVFIRRAENGKGARRALYAVSSVVIAAAVFFVCEFVIRSDYGGPGALAAPMFYLAKKVKSRPAAGALYALVCLSLCLEPEYFGRGFLHAFNPNEFFAVFAALPLVYYGGEKGRSVNRYFFYWFYPAHIAVFVLIKALFFA